MAWRVAKSITALHAQLKAGSKAAPPVTPAGAWGTISDAAHTSTSDHSPHDFRGWGDDIVTAGDFPDRPDLGLDARRVLDDIRRSRDPRVKYGISHGQMFSSYATSSHPAWTWRPYSGSDGHWTHGHLSVVGDARADGTQPWRIFGGSAMTDFSPTDPNAWRQAVRVETLLSNAPSMVDGKTTEPNKLAAALAGIASQASSNGSGITQILTAVGRPVPVDLTDAQLDALADKVATRLSALRFVAE